jgi:outer membrane PBP1 activator LpoA protein
MDEDGGRESGVEGDGRTGRKEASPEQLSGRLTSEAAANPAALEAELAIAQADACAALQALGNPLGVEYCSHKAERDALYYSCAHKYGSPCGGYHGD